MDDLESSISINVSVSDNSDNNHELKLENDFLDDEETDDGSEYEKSSTLKIQDSFTKELKVDPNDYSNITQEDPNNIQHGQTATKMRDKSKSKNKFSVILYWSMALGLIVCATVIAILIGGK